MIVATLVMGAGETLTFATVSLDRDGHTIYSLLQDSRGEMWLGTHLGLYDYDGYRIHKAFDDNTISNTHVNAMIQRGDSLLLGTDNGVLIYDMTSGTYHAGLAGVASDVRALALDGDRLLIGSLNGLYEFNMEDSTVVDLSEQLLNKTVYSLIRTPRGIYAGTYNGLAFRPVQLSEFKPVPVGGYDNGRNLFVNALCYDTLADRLYIGTEGSLIELECSTGRSKAKAFPGNSIKSIAQDHNGVLIVGTDNGLFTIDRNGTAQYRHSVSSPTSLSNNSVWSVAVDDANNIWAGTDYDLSVAYRNSDYTVTPISALTHRDDGNRIYSIYKDSHGILWLGGDHGIIMLQPDGPVEWFMPGDIPHSLSHSRVRYIFEDSADDIWIATDGGINRFNRKSGRFENHVLHDRSGKLNTNWAYSIVEDGAGRLWVGSYLGGMLMADRDLLAASTEVRYAARHGLSAANGLPNNFIHQMVRDDCGNIWVIYFKSDSITCVDSINGGVRNFSIGVSPTYLYRDDTGQIWCGFHGGIGRLTSGGTMPSPFKLHDAPEANIIAVGQVGGKLWLSTSEGVYAMDMVTGASRRLSLPAADYTAIYFDRENNRVLLGGVDSILEVNPDIAGSGLRQEPVVFTSIQVNGMPYGSTGSMRDIGILSLRPNQNHLMIEFSDFDYGHQMRQRWEYRIAGPDWAWLRLPEGDNRIVLPELGYGQHLLQIRPVDGSGDARISRELTIIVATPWYLTTLALISYAVLIVLIPAGVWLYVRTRRRMRAERDRSARTVETLQRDLNREKRAQIKPVENLTSPDDKQMAEVSRLVEANIADPDLSVAMLAEKTGMGQKQLYRLIKKHTDFSPVDYIRRERMNRAAALLSQRKMTVSEVMYRVGFSSSSYFSKCFQAQWGMTPRQYMERADN